MRTSMHPSPQSILALVDLVLIDLQAMPMIIQLMQDSSMIVRDSAAWTVGRVCELLPDEAINPAYLHLLLTQMMSCLSAEPRVAANSCWVGTMETQPLH